MLWKVWCPKQYPDQKATKDSEVVYLVEPQPAEPNFESSSNKPGDVALQYLHAYPERFPRPSKGGGRDYTVCVEDAGKIREFSCGLWSL